MRKRITTAAIAALMLSATVVLAADPGPICEASKLGTTAKYASCRLSADSKAAKAGTPADYSKCSLDKFTAAETKGAGMCPSNDDQSSVGNFLDACTDAVTTALSGGDLLTDPITCASDLSSTNADLGTCNGSLGTCSTNLSSTNADLAACQSQPVCGDGAIGGDETCESGDQLTCVSAGFAGGTLVCAFCTVDTSGCYLTRFVDNGDGTITDNQTKLIWEKKSDAGDIHDKDNTYTWSSSESAADGTAYTVFLSELNGASSGNCFTGKCDWRLASKDELSGLIDYSEAAPMIFSIFKAGATPGCSATSDSCSWTQSDDYWSSSTGQGDPAFAWGVGFAGGDTFAASKTVGYYVRAVRAGS